MEPMLRGASEDPTLADFDVNVGFWGELTRHEKVMSLRWIVVWVSLFCWFFALASSWKSVGSGSPDKSFFEALLRQQDRLFFRLQEQGKELRRLEHGHEADV